MKKQEAMSVGQIISQAINNSGNAEEYDRQRACYLWSELMGPTITRYTTRRWVDHDEMHVCLSSATLKNELSFHRDRIVTLINEAIGRNVIKSLILH